MQNLYLKYEFKSLDEFLLIKKNNNNKKWRKIFIIITLFKRY